MTTPTQEHVTSHGHETEYEAALAGTKRCEFGDDVGITSDAPGRCSGLAQYIVRGWYSTSRDRDAFACGRCAYHLVRIMAADESQLERVK